MKPRQPCTCGRMAQVVHPTMGAPACRQFSAVACPSCGRQTAWWPQPMQAIRAWQSDWAMEPTNPEEESQ